MISPDELKKIPLLSQLSDNELNQLGTILKDRRAPKGSYIVSHEDSGPSMMFILDGKVKVNLLSRDGKEVVVATLHEGDFFGEIAVLTGEERSANVVAVTECRIFVLQKEDFEDHLLKYPGLARVMLKEMAIRLRQATSKIGDLALYDVYRRVARTLRSIARVENKDGKEIHIIDDRPTHQELASLAGTSREMVTRALKGLEEDRCIIIEGKRIEILKIPGG